MVARSDLPCAQLSRSISENSSRAELVRVGVVVDEGGFSVPLTAGVVPSLALTVKIFGILLLKYSVSSGPRPTEQIEYA
jgi:hypothetical protein